MTETPDNHAPTLNWIEAAQNPWKIKLLDLRSITQEMVSTSRNPQMAENAMSYRADDGRIFIGEDPESNDEILAEICLPIAPILAPGVLFTPDGMENKWAIFFYDNRILFVRSWLREVVVTAETSQRDGLLYIHKIKGSFFDGNEPELVRAMVKFLLISHAIDEIFPAPLPEHFSSDLTAAGMWAMSMYGNMAHVGTFDARFDASPQAPLRSNSLLHIATAKVDLNEINLQVKSGIPIDILAADGLAALHWSLASENLQSMQTLIELGANVNIQSVEGATPLMNAAQSSNTSHLNLLLSSGADVNARDYRGFTAIHRAAEMGDATIVEQLLNYGAEANVEAEGYTPLSLAEMKGAENVIRLLPRR